MAYPVHGASGDLEGVAVVLLHHESSHGQQGGAKVGERGEERDNGIG